MTDLFYVALARGADFKVLKARGFRVYYPLLDDYVFLEVSDENKKLLNKQEELNIKFIRDNKTGKNIQTVTRTELDRMTLTTQDKLVPGQDIIVVDGYCSGLDGKIKELAEDGNLLCDVYGYKRVFSVTLSPIQVAKRGEEYIPVAVEEGLPYHDT